MKKSTLKFFALITVILLLFSACNAKNSVNDMVGNAGGVREDIDYSATENESIRDGGSDISGSTVDPTAESNRKIIETIELTVQTKEFDALIAGLETQIATLGGYIESSNVSGREFDSTRNRTAYLKIRIPAENSNSFTGYVSENSVVTNKMINTKDVTLSYVDMESRVAALEAEKAALEKLLDAASTMTDIIDIRDKLTDVIYEIESYKSQLRTYDNLVDYSTITVNIREVERTVIVEEQTTWQKIGTNLKNNFENVWDGTVSLFVFIISAIPYLIPITIITVVIIVIVRINKKSKAKKKAPTPDDTIKF